MIRVLHVIGKMDRAGAETMLMNLYRNMDHSVIQFDFITFTEEEAKEKEIPVQIGKFMMSANGKSIISKEERGFIKIVAHQESRVILGAQMMCARATDMIGEFVTAVANKLTVEQLLAGMRAHPTYNEAVGEALEEVFGEAIHVVPKKKPKSHMDK